jgi:RNAse (barnase) inhibitor barstar
MRLVKLDAGRITDWDSFHDVFAEAFGFPAFYGRNMDAWIDCMTSLDDPSAELSRVHAPPGGVVVLELQHVDNLIERYPEQYGTLIECAAFVNWRRIELGQQAVLALSFYKGP